MAAQQTRKILRIGVIQNGTIIEERLFPKPHDITIGTHHRNTFSIFAPELPNSYTLFEVKGGKYQLQFDNSMSGRISLAGAVFTIDKLKQQGQAVQIGHSWSVALDPRSRGKLVIGDTILLFQFVSPPPVRPEPQLPVALRGGPLKFLNNTIELTGTFGWSLLFSTLIQVGFVLYLVFEVPPPPRPVDVNDLPDEIRMILAQEQKPEEMDANQLAEDALGEGIAAETEEELADGAEQEQEEERRARRRDQEAQADASLAEPASREDRLRVARERVRQEAFFSPMFTSDGGTGPAMEQVFNMSDRRVDHVLRRVQARGDGSLVSRSGAFATEGGENGIPLARAVDVDVGERTGRTQERARNVQETDERERVRVRANIRGSRERVVGEGQCDPDALNRAMRQKVRDIQRCYERVLPDNPNLEGRVVLQFTIDERGRVANIRLVENEVGPQVGNCIEGRVRRWRFDACEGGSVTVQKTFIMYPARD